VRKAGQIRRREIPEERRGGEEEEGGEDESVMKRDGALPAETGEERETFVLEILGEGGEVQHEEVGQGERGDGEREDGDEAMEVPGLEDESEQRSHVADVRGEEKFAEAAAGEAERRDGIREKDEKRKREGRECGERKTLDVVEPISQRRGRGKQADGDDEESVAQVDALGVRLSGDERFVGGTKDLGKQVHAGVRETNPCQAESEGRKREGQPEVVGNGRAEGIGESEEEEVERAEEGHWWQ